jgi:hypothetical protein
VIFFDISPTVPSILLHLLYPSAHLSVHPSTYFLMYFPSDGPRSESVMNKNSENSQAGGAGSWQARFIFSAAFESGSFWGYIWGTSREDPASLTVGTGL